ncbi:hypothetical protein Rhe02_90300 [Rhizocola hellebori]|uniref:CHAT domain-containing protein n=1 Tax=Rhizocola hellebori TaxID=1392758 RepID=A0A8J3VM87_9ACTN|nr:DUF6236 family protein [Rhizocola hellebori]GIH10963.1 hypothetical protein Rhe02_90300 [Rhizocola hellebori]
MESDSSPVPEHPRERFLIYDFSALDANGNSAWYFLAVPHEHSEEFLAAVEQPGDSVDITQFGRMLASGFGAQPPEYVREGVHRLYAVRGDDPAIDGIDCAPPVDDGAMAEARELLRQAMATEGGVDFYLALHVAHLHLSRFRADPDQALDDLLHAVELFALVGKTDLGLVPEDLQPYIPATEANLARHQRIDHAVSLLQTAFDTDDLPTLNQAITALRGLRESLPLFDALRCSMLSNLAIALRKRWRRLETMADLDEAAAAGREAVERTPDGDPDKIDFLENLSLVLRDRFQATEAAQDIADAIQAHRLLLRLAAADHPSRMRALAALGADLITRIDRAPAIEDIDELVAVRREILTLATDDDVDQAAYRSNLGWSLLTRFALSEQSPDLDEATAHCRQAASRIPEGDERQSAILMNLVKALELHDGDPTSFDEAIEIRRRVLNLVSYNDIRYPTLVGGLADRLLMRLGRQGDLMDADETVKLRRKLVSMTAAGSAARYQSVESLREAVRARFRHTESAADAAELAALNEVGSTSRWEVQSRQPKSLPAPVPMKRGILTCGAMQVTARGGFTFSGRNDSLRAIALYWDKAIWAYGNGFGYMDESGAGEEGNRMTVGFPEEARDLERSGFLTRMRRDMYHPAWDPGGAFGEGLVMGIPVNEFAELAAERLRTLAIEMNRSNDTEQWSVGHSISTSNTTPDPDDPAGAREHLSLRLTMALPVPADEVPIERILEFRQRREDSLAALRRGIRNLTSSPDVDLHDLLDDVRLRLQEIDRLLSETFVQRWAHRTRVVLGIEDAGNSAIVGALGEIIGQSLHLPTGVGALAGLGVNSVLHLAQKRVAPQFLLPERVSDFFYLYEAQRLR